ncbi:MAG: twin-arginine translocation signal domain-containing protein [Isosphaeraceae bacterium]|nr:twin-arginine translocation signal domain-containing protein [Isosphaeraceae bacterium]
MSTNPCDPHHRRDFIRTLALGAAAGALAPPARADEPEQKDEAEQKDEPAKSEADARMEVVLARFGKQLDADARKAVRREVEGIVQLAEALRKYKLDNGEGPYPIFKPYRAPLA